jgi:hypothetical protein
MELMIQRGLLARFLDLRPKVIVASCDPLAEKCLDESDAPLFDVWVFTPDGATSGMIRPRIANREEGELVTVLNPTAAICVLAAETAEGCASLEQLKVWWTTNSPRPVSVLFCRDRDNAVTEILRVLLRATQQELHETTVHATNATAQMVALRCENDQTRVVVEALQNQMVRLRQRPQLMTLHLPPSGEVYAPPGGRGELVQSLQVSAEGMAGIDLHFPARGSIARDAQVMVRLHALDMSRDLGTWLLRARHLGKGWVRCWLPEVLGVASHNLEVRVEWLGSGDNPPAISLASAGDWEEMCAREACGTALLSRPSNKDGSGEPSYQAVDGCLALTAWAGGVPGMPLKSGLKGCVPQANGQVEYSLNAEELARMTLYVPPVPWKPDEWYPFQQRDDGSFMLHPIGPSATTLQLTNGCPPGVDRVTAVVKITSPKAVGDVLYAIAAARGDDANKLLDGHDLASDSRLLAFSGWQLVPRDDAAHVIVMEFPQPLHRAAHLLLATRMPPGVDHAWAWADWLDVRLRVRGLQVPMLEQAEPIEQNRAA